ncbi:MAG: thiolase family protein [Desulfobacterium sp.]|nr:thiolase family protein [Desulfobacteraceae bacterium]MBA3036877.1 thiolase family protein [Desulfobacterium sp.]MBU4035642.1 thiolase family protein [Pseudomonadota bacterium]
MTKEKLSIIGIGEAPTRVMPERSRWDIIYDVCIEAVRDSGLDKNDIEGVITVAPQAQNELSAEISFGKIPEELGLKGCRDVCICNAGGASTSNCLRLAEQWIQSGVAKTVLIPHVTVHSTIPMDDLINFFALAGMDMQWEYPFGTTYNGVIAMGTQRYMYESKVTPEEMAAVVVSLRKWASLDPNSIFYKKPAPTVEQVLSSPLVSDPLHRREGNILADGGSAMVVTSSELAPKITKTPVYKLGEGAVYWGASPVLRRPEKNAIQSKEAAKAAFDQAGITKEDIDIWNIYLAYPVGHPQIMEWLGVCEPGQAGKMFLEGHTWPGGKLPWSPIGDAVGRGHTGSGVSTATYVETARQLMGKAGERQVKNAKYVFQNTSGGSGMNFIATIWGRELS